MGQFIRGQRDIIKRQAGTDNTTVKVLQDKVAVLEQGQACLAFSSVMAAISNAILSVFSPGDKVVCINHVYPDTYRFLRGFCQHFHIDSEFVDGDSLAAAEAALPGAKLLYLENPSSWVMGAQILLALTALAREHGVNTRWASPLYPKSLTLGVDIVGHSASKYISGHSEVAAGLVIASRERIATITSGVSPFFGGKLSANEAWLLIRGLQRLVWHSVLCCYPAGGAAVDPEGSA